MAADTREPETSPTDSLSHDSLQPRKKPKYDTPKSQTAKLWEAFGNPEEPINLLPGANYNSAGGKPKEATLTDAFKTLSLSDLTTFYKTPCARDSLLVGMGAGFGIGGVRGILGGNERDCSDDPVTRANWC
jgi:cytochrome c oxidase assembly protein subunit 20